MRTFLLIVILISCGGGNNGTIDAGRDTATDTPIDMTPLSLDCTTYCTQIQNHCTGTYLQYPKVEPSLQPCMDICASFDVGTSKVTDTTGNTLGCRINHAAAAATTPTDECPRAGPVGSLLTVNMAEYCGSSDACLTFCTLEITACGSVADPLPNDPRDASGNLLFQYQNLNNCMTLCDADFDKRPSYSAMATGDSLACRLAAAVTARISLDSAKVHCRDTADAATGQCAGTASP